MSEILVETLAPVLQPLVRELRRRAKLIGIDTVIPKDGAARDPAGQLALYAQGRHHDESGRWVLNNPTTREGVVTNALPDLAPHCRRGAVDLMIVEGKRLLRLEGGLSPEERARQLSRYAALGRIGEEVGLEWGGRWASLHDYPHFQHRDWRTFPLR